MPNDIQTSCNKQKILSEMTTFHQNTQQKSIKMYKLKKSDETLTQTLDRYNIHYDHMCDSNNRVKENSTKERKVDSSIFITPTTPSEVFNKIMFCAPLSHICNLCIKDSIFPELWKTAIITPIHKK